MVACRSRGAAPTRCQATASAIAALGPLADVAVDGGRQTLPSLTPNLCLSRLIQESSGFWYRFQLLRLALDFPIGGFSPPEGRLARGCKPPAFSRFLFQSAVKSAESF